MCTSEFKTVTSGEPLRTVFPRPVDWPQVTTRIAEGDEDAFAVFYRHFFDRLFRYVLVMTRGDEPVSRDLLQKTMMKVVRYMKPFPNEVVLWSWLTQLAKTSYIDLLRREKRAPRFVSLEVVDHLSQPPDDRADENLVLEAALARAVDLLVADERELIQSVYFEERSHKEIAESLQATPKAVESKLARVRNKLRTLLTQILNDENQP